MLGSFLNFPRLLTYLLTLLIGITLHEYAHAKVADMLGDNTPRMNGRVTLNPLAHLDPVGSLMMMCVPEAAVGGIFLLATDDEVALLIDELGNAESHDRVVIDKQNPGA